MFPAHPLFTPVPCWPAHLPACPPAARLAQSAELPSQVDNLLKAVEATNIFESEMARRFEGASFEAEGSSDDMEGGGRGQGEGGEGGGGGGGATADDSTPASRVRQRYEKLARERQRVGEHESPQRRKEQVQAG